MSRYIKNYQAMKNKIQEIKNVLDDVHIQSILNEVNKVEFLRYKKNFSILEDIIENLAKSYMSYKEQIETLAKDEKNELLQKLLESTTATISQNPNHVLDKNNTDHHPAMEFFNTIWKRD